MSGHASKQHPPVRSPDCDQVRPSSTAPTKTVSPRATAPSPGIGHVPDTEWLNPQGTLPIQETRFRLAI